MILGALWYQRVSQSGGHHIQPDDAYINVEQRTHTYTHSYWEFIIVPQYKIKVSVCGVLSIKPRRKRSLCRLYVV